MKRFGLGFVFFVALVLLGFGTLLVGDLKDLFGPKERFEVHFARIQGLRVGDDVRVDGFLAGKVKKIELLPNEKYTSGTGVLVTLRLDQDVELYEDRRVLVESSSVLGGTQVSIRRGTRGQARKTKDIPQPVSGDLQPGLEQVGVLVDENKDNIHAVISNLKDLTQAIKDGQGTVGKLLKSDELHREAVDTIKAAKDAIAETRVEIKKLGDNVNRLVDKMDKGEGPVAHLLNDKKMTEDIQKTLDNVKGTSENLKKITDKVQSGESVLGKLTNDKEMGDQFKRIVDNMDSATESIKNVTRKLETGDSTVGKLLQDDELYQKARQTLDDIDKVFAKAARSVVEIVGEEEYFPKSKLTESNLGIRLTPSEDKFIYVGASLWNLNRDGDIIFKRQVDENKNDTVLKMTVELGYRPPWFLDHRFTVYGGFVEGRGGGGVSLLWEDWGLFSHPVQFTFEGRQAYTDLEKQKIDEQVSSMLRAYVKTPLWTRKDTWPELLLSSLHLYAGVNKIGTGREELLAAVGLEWPDDDLRTLVGFIGLAR